MKDNEFDVIIIGSGIAGLSTALSLDPKLNVGIFSKTSLTHSATNLAQGGIAAVVDATDSVESHITDTFAAGDNHNDKYAVQAIAKNGKHAVDWLSSLGVPFEKNEDGDYVVSLEAAHSHKRIVHATDFTGEQIASTLIAEVTKRKNCSLFENYFCTDLIIENDTCVGGYFFDSTKIIPIKANVVVLATGGAGQLYQWTTNPTVATADGIALGTRAGAHIADIEFIQFHPTALKIGESPLFLLSEALRGERAYVVNDKGERFLYDTLEKGELAPRDEVARAIYMEMKSHQVFIDMRHIETNIIQKRFPNIYKTLKEKYSLDLANELIPITPAAHYICGGVVTDLNGKTSVQHLYAVGEVTCTGVHGANRLASNSLLEGVVFGMEAGNDITRIIGQIARSTTSYPVELPAELIDDRVKQIITDIQTDLKQIMWEKVGIVRTRKLLHTALSEIGELHDLFLAECDAYLNIGVFETKNMIEVAKLIVTAALSRSKSLGAHYVIDTE